MVISWRGGSFTHTEVIGQLLRCRAAGAIGTDGRCRWAVTHQVNAWVYRHLGGQPPSHGDAPDMFAQHERHQMLERTAEPCTPQYSVYLKRAAIGPAYPC